MKPKVHIHIIHYNRNLYKGKKYYRSKLLNHLKGSFKNECNVRAWNCEKSNKRITKFMYFCELWIH
jgi:hypothetical protein